MPQISQIAEQVNQVAGNGCLKSPKSQNKSIKWREMVAPNLPKRRTSQSSGRKCLPQIFKIAEKGKYNKLINYLKSSKLQNKSITWQEMLASNLPNRKTSQSSAKKWLPQISKNAKQVNHPARNGCPKSPKLQNKSNILSHIG